MGYFYAKATLGEIQQWYYLTYSWRRYKGVHTFPKGISPKVKVNVVAALEFDLAYFVVEVQHFSNNNTEIPFGGSFFYGFHFSFASIPIQYK